MLLSDIHIFIYRNMYIFFCLLYFHISIYEYINIFIYGKKELDLFSNEK